MGSNFKIENLFFNVPARRKFLKSNATELNNILMAFERIALVYPSVAFTLHSNNTELLNLKEGGFRQRIVDIFGKRLNQDLLPVEVDTTLGHIHGFVGKPESAKKKGAHQYFFVNGRYMKHPYFHKAVQGAFDRLVPVGEQVPYFIYFEVPAADIDVNIHPTKTEIKFENEQAIWQILTAAVKDAIGAFNDVPRIDFDTQGKPEIPVFQQGAMPTMPKVEYNPQYNPFSSTPAERKRKAVNDWQQLYENLKPAGDVQQPIPFTQHQDTLSPDTTPAETSGAGDSDTLIADKSPSHYQYKGRYIMTAVKSGLMIIDQHRAHVRILYEHYQTLQKNRQWVSQKLLFPEIIQLTAAEQTVFDHVSAQMEEMGFELTSLGNGSYAVNAIPAGLEGVNPVSLVRDMVENADTSSGGIQDEIGNSLALSLARNAAIPVGQILGNEEMEGIINDLFACQNVNYTPDGKPILTILKQQEIDRLLG